MIDNHYIAQLTDFGLSFPTDGNSSTVGSYGPGALRFAAKEVLEGEKPLLASDIYSFACICLQVSYLSFYLS